MGLPGPKRLNRLSLRRSGRPSLRTVADESLPNRLEGDDLQASLEDNSRLTSYHYPKMPLTSGSCERGDVCNAR